MGFGNARAVGDSARVNVNRFYVHVERIHHVVALSFAGFFIDLFETRVWSQTYFASFSAANALTSPLFQTLRVYIRLARTRTQKTTAFGRAWLKTYTTHRAARHRPRALCKAHIFFIFAASAALLK